MDVILVGMKCVLIINVSLFWNYVLWYVVLVGMELCVIGSVLNNVNYFVIDIGDV